MTLSQINENAQDIAKTIADQLTQSKNGTSRLKAMIGGKDFVNLGNGLAFKISKSTIC